MSKLAFGLLFLSAFTFPILVNAQFEYVTNSDGKGITITGYSGPSTVVIPTNINGLTVTDIGEGAFAVDSVGSVTIPNTVTNIGQDAFNSCQELTNIDLPDSLVSVGYAAFAGSVLTSLTIPPGLTNIGYGAFAVDPSLTNVIIDYGITDIPPGIIGGEFTSIVIPASVTNIGDDAIGSGSLSNIFFAGNAPTIVTGTFALFPPPQQEGLQAYYISTAYYLPGTTGWDDFTNETFLESNMWHNPMNISLPLVLWNPTIQATGTNFGIQNGQYGFDITTTSTNLPIAIEACDDPAQGNWFVLQRLTLTNGLYHFSEPFQSNAPSRFYRIGFP